MTEYPLGALLRVRKIREDHAQNELIKTKAKLKEAEKQQRKQETRLNAYKKWRPKREGILYKKISHKKLHKEDLEEFKTRVENLIEREKDHEQRLEKRKEAVKKAEDDVAQARTNLIEASKRTQKIQEHKEIWEEDAKRAEEAFWEKESDDIPQKTSNVDMNSVFE
tara:strand:+ start:19799 stop:20296 length:498 start_codon:yes stop_codon:yes gene_type:complete